MDDLLLYLVGAGLLLSAVALLAAAGRSQTAQPIAVRSEPSADESHRRAA